MIQEIDIAQLDPRFIKQLVAADKAHSSDAGYSKEIYASILKQFPGCLELRQKLRAIQLNEFTSSGKSLSGLLGKVTIAPFFKKIKDGDDPVIGLQKAEDIIVKSPTNIVAHQMLAQAARMLGLLKTTAFAYETIRRSNPRILLT